MKTRYYLAYGSNLNIGQMWHRCPESSAIGTAVIEDYELLFKGSQSGSYLTIEPKEGASVPVAVWSVTGQDECYLDRYEGYPSFYYKKELTLPVTEIRSGEVRSHRCFVYIMHESRPIGVPTVDYMRICLEGYDNFGFDRTPLLTAYYNAKEKCRRERNDG